MIIFKQVKNLFGSMYAKLRGRKPAPPSKTVDPYAYREESVSRPWTPPKEFGLVPSAPKPIRVSADFMVGRPMPEVMSEQSKGYSRSVASTLLNAKGCIQESNPNPPKGLDLSRKLPHRNITRLQEEQQRRDALLRQPSESTSPCTTIHGTREFDDTLTDTLAAASVIAALANAVDSVEPIRYEREPDPIQSGGGGEFAGGGADASWNDSSSSSDNNFSND